jgi:hypothetical protein
MKTGRNLQEISQQILAQHSAKKDYVVNTGALRVIPTTPANPSEKRDVQLAFTVRGEQRLLTPTDLCLSQIADRVGIPKKYSDRMRSEAPDLLATNINHWFTSAPEKRMLRTLNNGQSVARAFLSDGYRPLDNFDLAQIALPRLQESGCEIKSCEITETRLYIQAFTPRIQAVIDQHVKIGTHDRINRTVQAGVIIGNSEVGLGSIFVEPAMLDLVCANGLILQRTLKKHHVGRRNEGVIFGDESSYELFSDETRKLDDRAFWSKVSDVIASSVNEVQFNKNIDRLREAQTEVLAEAAKEIEAVVEVTANRFNFSDDEKGNLLLHFAQGGDFSKYGLINAVTRTAEDVASYDRAVELERLGGQIIELPASDFSKN